MDDYGHYKGQRQALDEYLAEKQNSLLNRINYGCRVAVKGRVKAKSAGSRRAAKRSPLLTRQEIGAKPRRAPLDLQNRHRGRNRHRLRP